MWLHRIAAFSALFNLCSGLISVPSLFGNGLLFRLAALRVNEGRPEELQEVEPCLFDGVGCVLLAQPGEHDHFLSKAAVFVFEHNERGTQGVILGRQSAFSLGETAPGIGLFAPNPLFIGGESGPDMAIMFHRFDLGGYAKNVGGGIYVGGLRQARELVESRGAVPNDFKFIFNNVQWAPGLLQSEIEQKRWDVIRMPTSLVLEQKMASSIWTKARNTIRSKDGSLLDSDDFREDD